jgi:hypothetical protein
MRPTFIRAFAPTLAAIAFTAALLLAKWASAEPVCTTHEALVTDKSGAQHIAVHTVCSQVAK